MRSTITISIPEELRGELDKVSKEEGLSRSDVVRESLRDYLHIHRFRAIRKRLVAQAEKQGIFTDQDVFDRMS